MSDEDDGDDCDCPPTGAPLWMATFADLMSLLMCFFVLLLSFSEMDVKKYKAVSGSMKDAFGVQRKKKFMDDPTGTSFIMKHFGPGTPSFTPLPNIQQRITKKMVRFVHVRGEGAANLDTDAEKDNKGKETLGAMDESELQEELEEMLMDAAKSMEEEVQEDLAEQAEALKDALHEEIEDGAVEVVEEDNRIVVRIKENASFASASAVPLGTFKPIVLKVVEVLADFPGTIVMSGHTDNLPIKTLRYKSNWELSVARAVTTLHIVEQEVDIPPERLRIEGFGHTKPLEPNDTPENRAKNRRVEISIVRENDRASTIEQIRKAVISDG